MEGEVFGLRRQAGLFAERTVNQVVSVSGAAFIPGVHLWRRANIDLPIGNL